MRLLLDTHAFLWYITEDPRLPGAWAEAIQEESNEVFLSVVSVWEALAKHQLGKLPLPSPADEYLRRRREEHEVASLPFDEPSLTHLLRLPLHHRDPFDRMLICQALQHDLQVVTSDAHFVSYPITVFGAA
ncbi:MAG TPA: type II toxin-antitoxin system VapC family toxin [Thermoanaerobaculia bacterium]|nr:type II toxin-antitoxin system VapC family toxin [Thermoanaerobaculia bacterium]